MITFDYNVETVERTLEEQPWDNNNEASDGIPVLASDSDESVMFVVEGPLPSIQHPCMITRAATHALPTFSSSASDTSSSLCEYWPSIFSILINIFYWKHFSLVHIDKKFIIWYILFMFFWQKAFLILLWKQLPAVRRLAKQTKADTEKEFRRKYLNLCEFYKYCLISFSFCIIILLTFDMLYYFHFKHF